MPSRNSKAQIRFISIFDVTYSSCQDFYNTPNEVFNIMNCTIIMKWGSNEQLSFNYEDEAIAYIGSSKMHIKEAEIESSLTVTGQYSGSTMLQTPTINLGNFSLIVESNGSLSIVSNL